MARQVLRHHVGPLGRVVARCLYCLRRLRTRPDSQQSRQSRQSAVKTRQSGPSTPRWPNRWRRCALCLHHLRRLRTRQSAVKTRQSRQSADKTRQSARQDVTMLTNSVASLRTASTACDGCANPKTVSCQDKTVSETRQSAPKTVQG